MDHWLFNYLGKQWTFDYNCFDHFVEVQDKEYGISSLYTLENIPHVFNHEELLDYVDNNKEIRTLWATVDKPTDGCAVLFGSKSRRFHIGTYVDVDGGGVLHCDQKVGVIFTSMHAFRSNTTMDITFMCYKGS